jgi:glycerol kinase
VRRAGSPNWRSVLMAAGFVLALDQGTTSSRAMLFGRDGGVLASAVRELEQLYPSPGHVEYSPAAIWDTQLEAAREAIARANVEPAQIAAVGIANQRETTLVWERETGTPVANAIGWQSRITASDCEQLRQLGLEAMVRGRTGLPIDPYFSATKIRHILRSDSGLRRRAERGELLFGTVDTYLAWKLTGGRLHITDHSNASRTLLFNIHTLAWDDDLLDAFDVPSAMLPEVRSSSEVYGHIPGHLLGSELPLAALVGDQQAATFGQACFSEGMAKQTYGTGCFLMMNTGSRPLVSGNALLTTIGWVLGGEVTYCLEGAIFVGGAAVQWLRDGLRAIADSSEVERLAGNVADSGGVYFVPAFVGLGAPYWDPHARGLIVGITRGTTIEHIARAAVDSMAFQTRDLVDAMRRDIGRAPERLKVDGGATVNDRLLQLQADLLRIPVERPAVVETTALGAAYLAGLAVGFWADQTELEAHWALDRRFEPQAGEAEMARLLSGWDRAVARSLRWEE